nr:hypothetical protein GTC16762_32810 [Pigmentibacter ruber]
MVAGRLGNPVEIKNNWSLYDVANAHDYLDLKQEQEHLMNEYMKSKKQ